MRGGVVRRYMYILFVLHVGFSYARNCMAHYVAFNAFLRTVCIMRPRQWNSSLHI
jgi:hypothetical protein